MSITVVIHNYLIGVPTDGVMDPGVLSPTGFFFFFFFFGTTAGLMEIDFGTLSIELQVGQWVTGGSKGMQ